MTAFRPGHYILLFTCSFLIGFGLLLTPPVQSADVAFSAQLVKISHGLIVAFGGHATRDAAILRAEEGFAVEMRDGCNAVNVTILLWSAVLAFPASWKNKVLGLVVGSIIVQVLNIGRFISLFYLGQYSMTWFEFAHSYLWESLLVLDTVVIFRLWVKRAGPISVHPNAGA
ncbi:MAG: exosortase H [Bryobacteraceae bacterium]|nr:exosortase H [Bryobacteraceae bacterium]